jgi:hypothetical protein
MIQKSSHKITSTANRQLSELNAIWKKKITKHFASTLFSSKMYAGNQYTWNLYSLWNISISEFLVYDEFI